ncbi:MAG TPA: radical SAM protein [Terriglobales bacterium]|jgi:radical SAM protein with 4Fe4S-binding SPASM domain|nr:radical SAM protein [Terriglobales bacterium]
MSLIAEVHSKALRLGIPLNVHVDITYRCNERCQHCYLDHEDAGEMSTDEVKDGLRQLAQAGAFFLTISGGEPLLRRDCLEILAYARKLSFNVKLKTNGLLIGEQQAAQLCELGIEQVQISVYSHRSSVHDSITKIRGSWLRTLEAIRRLKSQGLRVTIANVLMKENIQDYAEVQALARELGVHCTLDPTITPKMDGNTDILAMRISGDRLAPVFHDPSLVGNVDEFCAPPGPVDDDILDGIPCSAGHTSCYISPYGDVYPCVQFPLTCGNLRKQSFWEIWRGSPQFKEVRSIRARELHTCSGCTHVGTCSRCPGLAYMEGDMRGPSRADCDKAYVRTGIPSAQMIKRSRDRNSVAASRLVQISIVEPCLPVD